MSSPDREIYTSADDTHQRLCDFCNKSKALLYCRADLAKLCLRCDREVHATNQLFKKHNRSLLCDSCNSSPSSIFCRTESAVLCQNCDWETHNDFGSVHERRPLEGFIGCPSVSDLLNFLGLEELGKKNSESEFGNGEEYLDFLDWETPSIVSLDDSVVPSYCGHSFQAMGVPPLPKNRNATCGKYKEEILSQLREMAETETNFIGSLEKFEPFVVQSLVQGKLPFSKKSPALENTEELISIPAYGTSEFKSYEYNDSFVEMNHVVPVKDSEACDSRAMANGLQDVQSYYPVNSNSYQVKSKAAKRELNIQERDSAISRYKEKRKTRRYDKQVRYESRRVRAETRTRIKGRFAKVDH